jgi:hypothetical protein
MCVCVVVCRRAWGSMSERQSKCGGAGLGGVAVWVLVAMAWDSAAASCSSLAFVQKHFESHWRARWCAGFRDVCRRVFVRWCGSRVPADVTAAVCKGNSLVTRAIMVQRCAPQALQSPDGNSKTLTPDVKSRRDKTPRSCVLKAAGPHTLCATDACRCTPAGNSQRLKMAGGLCPPAKEAQGNSRFG